jgi:hypothetical protein
MHIRLIQPFVIRIIPYLRTRRTEIKSLFGSFSEEKNKNLLFLKKKKQKDFYVFVRAQPTSMWTLSPGQLTHLTSD